SSGVPCISGMNLQSRVWTYGLFMVACLCCSSLLIGASNPVTNPEEVKALGAIKSSLIDPCGNLTDWDQGDPCTSNWTGVFCYNTTLDDGYLHVQRLLLLRMNLSGNLSPQLGRLSNLKILGFMWNNISGSIPKEIGSITSLELLLLNGNQLTGPLPEELGYLPNMDRIQIDENQISGPLPKSFANLNKTKHFHMNNNSISGQIPPELSRLPSLVHFQLDNNNFNGTTIPANYSKMSKLLKLELQYNKLSNINFTSNSIPPNSEFNKHHFCLSSSSVPTPYENSPTSPVACFCARPLFVGYRLKSPGFSDFRPYRYEFEVFLTSRLELSLYQLYNIDSFTWEEGPRLVMHLKFFPVYDAENNTHGANSPSSGLSKGTLAGLVLGTIAVAITLSAIMLVYEFMSNSTLRDHLSAKCNEPLNFAMRLRIAQGSAKGILYLHTEANPPIFHRDIKASNILLDSKYMAKVADFGLS
ncbi:putative lrr receptor-like serine/threonine-protein kinase, partial [Quercus suber]